MPLSSVPLFSARALVLLSWGYDWFRMTCAPRAHCSIAPSSIVGTMAGLWLGADDRRNPIDWCQRIRRLQHSAG
ncbi:hypothetical protein L207DRAFT_520843 [Hyaloscypha variabilis F]|uniref:Uncharacterized protein n=1 Tax=Hyaloscypha variabilis (strain UAMH 11265 / GT02V1 / F) TaxID=1149755 RepID=A0A2J6QTF3_HYAVF|nr:hypothetical protein L207DRAFT_520843 [Hyaloscypha variabilis F]